MPCAKPAATPAGPASSAPLRRTREMRISELGQKAERGNAVAQTALGVCYLEGIDVEVDDNKALRLCLLSAAADQGVPRAKTNLARMCAEGVGTAKKLPEAVRLYEKVAEAGEFVAQVELARIYARGVHVPANAEAARKWYAAAAPQKTSVGNCEKLEEAMAYVT